MDEGLYESLSTEALEALLEQLDPGLEVDRTSLDDAEAGDRLALHFGRILRRAVESLPQNERARRGVTVVRSLVGQLAAALDKYDPSPEAPVDRTDNILVSILGRRPDGTRDTVERPLTPLLDTTLLTNAPGEPRVGLQILREIDSADRIDVVMAFIRSSGLKPLVAALRRHGGAGKPIRVLTTTYTGSTEGRALDALAELGARVRVSYDTTSTRLHAKAWLFHRSSGFSTAYIGSSNLTHSAHVDGLEWNVRVSGARNPDVIEKMSAVFDSYWAGGEFEPYDAQTFEERTRAAERGSGVEVLLSPVEIRLEPFQERLLEQVELARQKGHHANLLVSATGTGKTVMAAVDYARLRDRLPRSRLLFVAHRQEILERSRATFRHALRDAAFGELWVGGERPRSFEHVFASIQSLSASGLKDLQPGHFDVVIVDEFHHAAANSYEALLSHAKPRELLGLTATPERADGLSILDWFDGQVAAELRLWDAVDQHRLTPFRYFGIHDGTDLRSVPWRRSRGYDVEGLTNVFTADDVYARRILQSLRDHVDDVGRMRALGFCVSVAHARFMARLFNEHGVPAAAVWSDTPFDERRAALEDLRAGRVNIVFSVDLFNEGVDLPTVSTLLMLRPTDSGTLFLQQLGRGLRKAPGKSTCLVLDFVGHHRTEFRFDRRFRALLGGTRRDVEQQVEAGFPFLPAGCHLELDRVASDIVLESIRKAVPSNWMAKAAELRRLAESGRSTTLGAFIHETGLELDDVYRGQRSWSDLKADAGLHLEADGPHETTLRKACGRLLHVDDSARLTFYRELMRAARPPDLTSLSERERRLVRMLVASVASQAVSKATSLEEGAELLFRHPQVRAELCELFEVLEQQVDHVHRDLGELSDVPLRIHARYTRIEILAGFGIGSGAKVASWQQGVRWEPKIPADLFAFTLDKTSGNFSPTTRYRDYAISRELIHWESQSWTRAGSATGRRYQQHAERGSHVMLFARLRQQERAFFFLGPATYVSHTSEQPMGITWRLHHPLPGDLFQTFAAAVA